ncbi:SurA N-terminal domain-containing protein [Nitrobacter sp. JJSN]|uniref:SurA N-terminal domain-containing protein n=1 Tax=Nitrobacter sp. JJSN TaxID=3453033 RepID=UPI003F773355
MKMILLLRAFFRFAVFAILPLACLNSPLHAQSVAVMVNGEPITTFDIEQRSRLIQISTHKTPTRQQVVDELIDEKVKVKEAKKYGVNPTSADVDQAYASMGARMRMSPEQLTKSLASQGVRPDTIKARLKADLVWGSLVRGRFKDSLLVSDRDVNEALKSSGDDQSKTEGFEYQMRPIVLIVPRGAAASVMEARRKEADSLRERVQSCEEATSIFKAMRNATIRDTVVKTSADLPPPLRDLLDKTPVGHLTPPEVTRQGVEMVAVCGKKTTSVDTPKKKEIREKMFTAKYEKKSKDYLDDIRKSAMIEYRQGGPGKKGE